MAGSFMFTTKFLYGNPHFILKYNQLFNSNFTK